MRWIIIMNISFAGKHILVTGAGEGFGKAIVKKLLECKANVTAVDQSRILLEALKKEFPEIKSEEVNLANWDETRKTLRAMPNFDGLVNNAGLITVEPFLNVKSESFDSVVEINIKGLFNVCQVIARKMVEAKKGGTIINITTHAAQVGFDDQALLRAAQGSINRLTRNMAIELGPYNIRTNCIHPTVVMTDMGKRAWSEEKKDSPLKAQIPLRRFGEISDVVYVVLFLLSEYASFLNGTPITVDGGRKAARNS